MPEEGRRCEYAGELMTFVLFFWRLTTLSATTQRLLAGEVMIVSPAALKGSKGRQFDTPAVYDRNFALHYSEGLESKRISGTNGRSVLMIRVNSR